METSCQAGSRRSPRGRWPFPGAGDLVARHPVAQSLPDTRPTGLSRWSAELSSQLRGWTVGVGRTLTALCRAARCLQDLTCCALRRVLSSRLQSTTISLAAGFSWLLAKDGKPLSDASETERWWRRADSGQAVLHVCCCCCCCSLHCFSLPHSCSPAPQHTAAPSDG